MPTLLRFEIRRTLRDARFLVFLFAVPVAMYLVYGPSSRQNAALHLHYATVALVSMAVYSMMGAGMWTSGPALARERANGWMRQLRVTPLSGGAWLTAKLLQGITLVVPGLVLLGLCAVVRDHVRFSALQWGELTVTLLLGVIPFIFVGLLIGLLLNAQTGQVAQIATLMLCAFLSGLFIPWSQLPHWAQTIGRVLPSYHVAAIGWNILADRAVGANHIGALLAWTVVLGAVVVRTWRHESTAS